MTASLWPAPAATVDTHVHVDDVVYRPLAEFQLFWQTRRAVLSEHFTSQDGEYIARIVADDPERYRGLLLVRAGEPPSPNLERILSAPHLFGARIPVHSDEHLAALGDVLGPAEAAGSRVSLHCTWPVVSGGGLLAVIDRHPRLHVRIEHFGAWPFDQHPAFDGPGRELLERPSVHTMISSRYAFTDEPFPYPAAAQTTRAYLDAAGSERAMWSADWNRNDLDPRHGPDYLAESTGFLATVLSEQEIADVLWATAERFFGFTPQTPASQNGARHV